MKNYKCTTYRRNEKGNVLFYILLAVGLLAALTFSFTKGSRENTTTQIAYKTAEELYVQANVIRSTLIECVTEFPGGGGDITGDGTIDSSDNPNPPYPVVPTHADNPHGVAANDNARNLSCTGAPVGEGNIFQGAKNKGRFLPSPPTGFSEWEYLNDASGVRIRITAPNTGAAVDSLNRLIAKFNTCQADLNYGGCGARCLTVWVHRIACP